MKLLIITQVIDIKHSALGFFHRWLEEFAKHCEQVHVIALETGDYNLPDNVIVHSLGKERGLSKISYLINFYKLIVQLRNDYDQVFVHMNQVYVILGSPVWKIFNKKVSFWYVHKQVTLSLKLATLLATKIFSSVAESFRVKTKKIEYVGHGIDLQMYYLPKKSKKVNQYTISHFGRIAKIKNIKVLIEAVSQSKHKDVIIVNLYGEAQTQADSNYQQELEALVVEKGVQVNFCGAVSSNDVPQKLTQTDLSVNLTPTGGWDKVVLEAMASKTPVLTSNNAYTDLFGEYAKILFFKLSDINDLVVKIDQQLSQDPDDTERQVDFLHAEAQKYDLSNLIPKLIR